MPKYFSLLRIIPIAFISTFVFKAPKGKIKIPYFIGLFILAMIANTYFPIVQEYGKYLVYIAKSGLTLTLFLIGCGLSKKVLQSVGIKPLIQGVALWLIISLASLWVIMSVNM